MKGVQYCSELQLRNKLRKVK